MRGRRRVRAWKLIVALMYLFAFGLGACGGGRVEGGADVAGTYVMDQEAARAAAKTWLMQNPVPPGMTAEEFERRIDEGLAEDPGRSAELVLRSDGSFDQTWTLGDEVSRSKGTWTVDEGKLTLVATHENGKDTSDRVEVVAEYEDGTITLSEKIEHPVVFRKN